VTVPEAFIAVDWGTTNRRAYLIEGGQVVRSERDAKGVTALTAQDYPAEIAGLRDRLGDRPVLLAGMVGSTIGWRPVPYVAAPADLAALAGGCAWLDDRIALIPGLSFRDGDQADVMRGEEVQLLGAAVAGLVPDDALLCQPGTHCKWAQLKRGAIVRFTTAMTGELFALLRGHSVLAGQLGGTVADGPAFRAGLADGARRDLAASLFGVRARSVLGLRDDADAASYISAMLIGADVAARLDEAGDRIVHVVADPGLGALYAVAIDALGGRAVVVDSETAFVAGINRIRELVA
jgi:2-dehydro-3-deoxygalactonokinase